MPAGSERSEGLDNLGRFGFGHGIDRLRLTFGVDLGLRVEPVLEDRQSHAVAPGDGPRQFANRRLRRHGGHGRARGRPGCGALAVGAHQPEPDRRDHAGHTQARRSEAPCPHPTTLPHGGLLKS